MSGRGDFEKWCAAFFADSNKPPEGWKLVPMEPDEAMLIAGAAAPRPSEKHSILREAYLAMLTAAPERE